MPQGSEQGPCGPVSVLRVLVNPEGLTDTENRVTVVGESRRVMSPVTLQWGCCRPRAPHPRRIQSRVCSVLRPHLSDELAPLVHADVFLALSPLDAHPAPKGVCLHYELGCHAGETSVYEGCKPRGWKPPNPHNPPDPRPQVGNMGRP